MPNPNQAVAGKRTLEFLVLAGYGHSQKEGTDMGVPTGGLTREPIKLMDDANRLRRWRRNLGLAIVLFTVLMFVATSRVPVSSGGGDDWSDWFLGAALLFLFLDICLSFSLAFNFRVRWRIHVAALAILSSAAFFLLVFIGVVAPGGSSSGLAYFFMGTFLGLIGFCSTSLVLLTLYPEALKAQPRPESRR